MSDLNTRLTITGVTFSYANVWVARAHEEGAPLKYSVSLLIPKTDKATIKKIEKCIANAIVNGKSKLANKSGKIPSNLKTPFRDGDEDRPDDEAYQGCMFINANTTRRPQVVDKNVEPILDQDEFYSGCLGNASVNFYPYNVGTSKGIAAGLGNVQKISDGDPLSGGASAADDFGSSDADADDEEEDNEEEDDDSELWD